MYRHRCGQCAELLPDGRCGAAFAADIEAAMRRPYKPDIHAERFCGSYRALPDLPWLDAPTIEDYSARDRAIAMLDSDPALLRAMYADDSGDPVRVGYAVRGSVAVQLEIPRARYDGLALLELFEKRSIS